MKKRYQEFRTHNVRILSMVVLALFLFSMGRAIAGTTGKIAGLVTDASTGEPIPAANVSLKGTAMGTMTDMTGFYSINNVPPGKYSIAVSYIGYRRTTVTDIIVKIDLTAQVNVKLASEAVMTSEVVVTAERPLVQKDLTSTSVTVSDEELKRIPMENISQIINIQAGVVGGHFRGGRANEIAYLIDGVTVNDPYGVSRSDPNFLSGVPITNPNAGGIGLGIENPSIRAMEVISGTFNAEYGQAMSGVINIVTQDGGSELHGSVSAYTGDYLTGHKDVFPNVGKIEKFRTRDMQVMLSGPALLQNLTFFVTGRYFEDRGYLYGTRVYNTTDESPTIPDMTDKSIFINHNTGDGAFVPMNPAKRFSFNGKISLSLADVKISYNAFYDDNWNKYYNHGLKWTPDGIKNHYRTDFVQSFQIAHFLSENTLQSLKISRNRFDYKGYLYPDPYDTKYVSPTQGGPLSDNTFNSGGNETDRYDRYSQTMIGQWSFSSQVSRRHKIGAGIEARFHTIYAHGMTIMNQQAIDTSFVIRYPNLGVLGNQEYLKKPVEYSAYVQDKMEYESMIVNVGARFDYFDPRSEYPTDLTNPLRNPNYLGFDKVTTAKKKLQVSPRLGVSFPITDQGIIHFSYGHFFQIPGFDNLYTNSDYLVSKDGNLSTVTGNPDLEPERTVMYEAGLQQAFSNILSLDFTVYYRDIRNLLATEIIKTREGYRYARYVNRDYGNVKGFIITLDKRLSNYFSFKLDYTYQIAEGVSSDPQSEFYNNQADPPIQTNTKVVPLNWDQRSTLNLALTVGDPGDWNVGLIFQYGSGFPYTPDTRFTMLRFENRDLKPSTFNVDLRAEKAFNIGGLRFNLFALVYNLLDTKNEINVDAASGRTNIPIFTVPPMPIIGINTLQEYLNNPSNYSAPRQMRVGLSLDF